MSNANTNYIYLNVVYKKKKTNTYSAIIRLVFCCIDELPKKGVVCAWLYGLS
jgi:hypothetical protein